MGYYEENLQCIKERWPKFADTLLMKINEDGIGDAGWIETTAAKNGENIIYLEKDQRIYRLNSSYYPSEEAGRWAGQFEFNHLSSMVSIYGLGNGIFVDALMKNLREGDNIIVYEPSLELFCHTMMHYNLTGILKRKNLILFVQGINEEDIQFIIRTKISLINYKAQLRCIHPQYDKIFEAEYARFLELLKSGMESAVMNLNTKIHLGIKMVSNIIKNMKYLKKGTPLSRLRNQFPKDIPAVVVAAGPSLKEEIERLKACQGKCIIIAVDRILDYLLEEGIRPDLVVTVDPRKEIHHFTTREDVDVPLISYLEANHEIFKRHHGEKFLAENGGIVNRFFEWNRQKNEGLPAVAPSGSVAIVAYTICVYLGFERVILIGQDLAYRDGISHAGENEEENRERFFVEGIDGNPVESRNDWADFIKRYQQLIKEYTCTEVIDAKDRGAKIPGAINMSFEEAVRQYMNTPVDAQAIISGAKQHLFEDDDFLLKVYQSHLKDLKNMKNMAEKASRECSRLINTFRRTHIFEEGEAYRKLSKLNKEIQENKIYTLLDLYITPRSVEEQMNIGIYTEDKTDNKLKTYENAGALYKVIIEATDFAKELLEEAVHELDC